MNTLKIVEESPTGKKPGSYLLRGEDLEFVFHAVVATDLEGDNSRVVTMYLPDPGQWENGARVRGKAK